MRAKRVDGNHSEIITEFKKLGAKVWDTSALGRGFPDVVVAIRTSAHGVYRMMSVEIKNSERPPSARKLSDPEQRYADYWPAECHRVVTCIADVTKMMLEHPAAPDGHGDCPWRGELDQCPI